MSNNMDNRNLNRMAYSCLVLIKNSVSINDCSIFVTVVIKIQNRFFKPLIIMYPYSSINPYPAEFLEWNNPHSISGTLHYHF